ncbi:hypothetical protein MY11210_009462 [Beauveria gryllotalpidicola]
MPSSQQAEETDDGGAAVYPEYLVKNYTTALIERKGDSDSEKREALYGAIIDVEAYAMALMKPDLTFNGLAAKLRQAANLYERKKAASHNTAFVTDREYHNRPAYKDNRRLAYGDELPDEADELLEQMYTSNLFDDDVDNEDQLGENFLASSMTITNNFLTADTPDPGEVAAILANAATRHALLADQPYQPGDRQAADVSTPTPGISPEYSDTTSRYCEQSFRGILPDTGASGNSTAGMPQVKALLRIMPHLEIEGAPVSIVEFGAGSATSEGKISVPTSLSTISFRILSTPTPFLFSLTDMDRMRVKFDNLDNLLIQDDRRIPVVRQWGHPWWRIDAAESTAFMLSETQLRQLHRRFGHPSISRLIRILKRADEEFDPAFIERINEDDVKFNFEIIVDVFYIQGRLVLHVVDSATAFQAARFLSPTGQKARDTARSPPDYIAHDAGRNFASAEFKEYAKSLSIQTHEVPVEAHNVIGKAERYHGVLRRAYEILDEEVGNDMTSDQKFQAAVKAVNDTAAPDGLVPTLLVFGAYPRLTDASPPSASVTRRAEAVQKAIDEVRKLLTKQQVKDALGMRNGPITSYINVLPLQLEVCVFREKGGWQGPYRLIAVHGETCTLDMPRGPANFRSTVVRPYLRETPALAAVEPESGDVAVDAGDDDRAMEKGGEGWEDGPALRSSTRPGRGEHSRDRALLAESIFDDAFFDETPYNESTFDHLTRRF